MTELALLRHAPTAWNRARRLQGRADISLSAESLAELARRRLPGDVAAFRVLASPLKRCLETAAALGLSPATDQRLIEMHWGRFEGHTLPELRRRHGFDLASNEAQGLDFRPPEGESPRDVQNRMAPLLAEIAAMGRPTIAVTHRGVIRAVYARAIGWDMVEDPPHGLDLYALHRFVLKPDGTPEIVRLNIPLERK
jgi:probable phosphoglycerate mutase